MLTAKDVAKILGKHVDVIYRMHRGGKLTAAKTNPLMFTEEDVQRICSGRGIEYKPKRFKMTNCIICQNTIREKDVLTAQMITEDGHLDGDCFCGDCGIEFLVWVLERQSSEKEVIQRFKDFRFSNRS